MTLGQDALLGPYRVIRLLGAGEMGEVYRAHDARLGRDVAIKVLPDRIAKDPDMVARFEREVRAIAALSHPNVLGIYDVGRTPDVTYAVMELVPGVTLRERMATSPLPHSAVVDIALQMARGLAAAHAKQIVHRDLKPENVLVSEAGQVKILDFGIAKVDPLGVGSDRPTLYNTAPGVVLGTLAYMAPEQLRGVPVDHRADIFAFGSIAFDGSLTLAMAIRVLTIRKQEAHYFAGGGIVTGKSFAGNRVNPISVDQHFARLGNETGHAGIDLHARNCGAHKTSCDFVFEG
jgi:serine/threonine protein kinase